MDIQRVHATLSAAERRRDGLLMQGIRLKDDGKVDEATTAFARAEKLRGQIGALERALRAWRRY
ncbi:MAG TPA: hypothetical protein VMF64_12455 [Steroidobacteraceae bacterium]|nr:hypothetical protein [Steroidobacteraceae bacterium]